MNSKNFIIKVTLVNADMTMWQLAELLGVADATLSRYMRTEFSESTLKKIVNLINSKDIKQRKDVLDSIRAEVCKQPDKKYLALSKKRTGYDPLAKQYDMMSEKEFERLFLET